VIMVFIFEHLILSDVFINLLISTGKYTKYLWTICYSYILFVSRPTKSRIIKTNNASRQHHSNSPSIRAYGYVPARLLCRLICNLPELPIFFD
jgi:hypothetical protein